MTETSAEERSGGRTGTVLVVDDEPSVVDLYARMLESDYDVRTATSGAEALDHLDERVDVILLDRRMPDLTGGEVLARLRENGYECMVAMITAVRPEQDILSMDFDAYWVKPIGMDELIDLVDELLLRTEYSETTRELIATGEKLAALRAEHDPEDLESMDEYVELEESYERKLDESEGHFEELADRVNPGIVYRDILGD